MFDPRRCLKRVEAQIADMASSRPWDVDEPPLSIYVGPASFVRRVDGIWCRKDTVGCLYLVNGNGERCAQPKTFEKVRWFLTMTKSAPVRLVLTLVEDDDEGGAAAIVDSSSRRGACCQVEARHCVRTTGHITDGGECCQNLVTHVAQMSALILLIN